MKRQVKRFEEDLFAQTLANDFLALAVAEFRLLLRDSEYKGNASYDQVLKQARKSKGEDAEGYRGEFIRLVETVKELK